MKWMQKKGHENPDRENVDPTLADPRDIGVRRMAPASLSEADRLHHGSVDLARGLDRSSGVAGVAGDLVPDPREPDVKRRGLLRRIVDEKVALWIRIPR
jgi:hypothetical protein